MAAVAPARRRVLLPEQGIGATPGYRSNNVKVIFQRVHII
jgi:hypothetical protein